MSTTNTWQATCTTIGHAHRGALAATRELGVVVVAGARFWEDKDMDIAHSAPISAVLTDVDGTLVTKDKVLTPRALAAVAQLRERGVVFTITSGRPPYGMRMLVEPLGLTMPMAGFNGGMIVMPDLSVLDERLVPDYLLPAIIAMIEAHDLDVFLFRTQDWCVRSLDAPRVAREASNIQTAPIVVSSFDDILTGVVKVVGVSNDHERVAACEAAMQEAFGGQVSAARSQPHYLDVTHPQANKGVVIERLARYLNLPLDRIAAVGDQPNDVLMFDKSGLSIAMGNAGDDVKEHATVVTTSYADEGFANAVEQFILPNAEAAEGAAIRPTGRVHRLGQSLWLDADAHDVVESTLERVIDDLSVSGLCAHDVDAARDVRLDEAFDEVRVAADLLRPIHDASTGVNGWVSVDATPLFAAYDGDIARVQAWIARVERPNVMIRVPAIPALLPAIEDAVFAGIAVDATLVYSREQYLAAAEAFLCGIERRLDAGLRPDVASIVSIDVAAWDDAIGATVPPSLRGQLGVAMAQRTYRAFRALLHSPRWQRVYNGGARTQRLRFVTTSSPEHAKPKANGVSRALHYVEALTAQFTIVTLSERALTAFSERGRLTTLLHADGGDCETKLAAFHAAGVDLYALATTLQSDAARRRKLR